MGGPIPPRSPPPGPVNALATIAPIFGIVLIGWGAALAGLLSDKVSDGLSEYVFAVAVPALIIATLTKPGMSGTVAWSYWVSYFGGAGISWFVGTLIARRRAGIERRGAILHGFAASQSNTVFVGVPMILQAYGEEGAFPLFMLLAVHLPLMMGSATFLIESDSGLPILARHPGPRPGAAAEPDLRGAPGRHGDEGPRRLRRPASPSPLLDAFAGTASTCALVALGAGLKRYRVLFDLKGALVIAGAEEHPAPAGGLDPGLPRLRDAARLCRGGDPVRRHAGGDQRLPAGGALQDRDRDGGRLGAGARPCWPRSRRWPG